jgi:hypothetical protein
MNLPAPSDQPNFLFNLEGRVRNLSLPASAMSALIPLFEAVSNSLHAIEARFGEGAVKSGEIEIEIRRRKDQESHILGFAIRDNGIGLTNANMESFRTSDSPLKLDKGGKGIGRLSWLKVFQGCSITSRYLEGESLQERSFEFALSAPSPITQHKIRPASIGAKIGTEVRLNHFRTPYEVHCPKKTNTIAAKLVGHFLPYLVVHRLPRVTLLDASDVLDLRQYYSDNQQRSDIEAIKLQPDPHSEPQEFYFHHVLLRKQLKFLESGLHWLFFAGNERVAREENIDSQLGLKYVGDDSDSVYVGLVSGAYLDSHVNQERTGFTVVDDRIAQIHKSAVASAKEFLATYISRLRDKQIETTGRIIKENPQFLPFRDSLEEFVDNNLSLNTLSEEVIFLELSRRKLRVKCRLDNEIMSIKSGVATDVQINVEKITKALNDEKKSSLAEYVVRRKEILEVLSSSLAYRDPETRRYFREDVVRNLLISH